MTWSLPYTLYTVCISLLLIPSFAFAEVVDTDNDGLSDNWEAFYYTDPKNPDTDGDGYLDGSEIANGYSPHAGEGTQLHQHDYDGDGLHDWAERRFLSDIGSADTDGDGYADLDEVMYGYSPTQSGPTMRMKREIVVDLSKQRLYYDVDGFRVFGFPVSTGNPGTPTPVGTFEIQRKVEVKNYVGSDYFVPDVWWNMQFIPMYYIHSAYWHNDFGRRTHSHGCVNMTIEDAKFLYQYVEEGMTVTVTGTTPGRYVVGT